MLNAESSREESLRSSPEARLWLTVLLQAANHLKDSTEWLSKIIECKVPESPGYERADYCMQLSLLHNHIQRHVRRVREAEKFFLGPGSTFGEICQILGYDEARLRTRVEAWLQEHADTLRGARVLAPQPGFGDRGVRNRKGRTRIGGARRSA